MIYFQQRKLNTRSLCKAAGGRQEVVVLFLNKQNNKKKLQSRLNSLTQKHSCSARLARHQWSHLKHWTPPQTPPPEAQASHNTCTSHHTHTERRTNGLPRLPSLCFRHQPPLRHLDTANPARCECGVKLLPLLTPPPAGPLLTYLHLQGPSL